MKTLKGNIEYKNYIYWYEYKLAKDRVDKCLATKDPNKYCNGFYLYSTKDPGNGKAFVITQTNNPNFILDFGFKSDNSQIKLVI